MLLAGFCRWKPHRWQHVAGKQGEHLRGAPAMHPSLCTDPSRRLVLQGTCLKKATQLAEHLPAPPPLLFSPSF